MTLINPTSEVVYTLMVHHTTHRDQQNHVTMNNEQFPQTFGGSIT